MSNLKTKNIRLSSFFSKSISSRSSISMLLDNDISDAIFILDFERIDFVSRSAAQQLELEKTKLKAKNVQIYLINTNDNINKMIELAKNKSRIVSSTPVFIKTFSSEKENLEYLLSI